MVATIKTFSFICIEVVEVDVQVKITSGMPGFSIVGLPDKSVGESKERVIAALSSTGLSFPNKKNHR
jgi:magnesium chelatase family protein